jgi:hypothetical protein
LLRVALAAALLGTSAAGAAAAASATGAGGAAATAPCRGDATVGQVVYGKPPRAGARRPNRVTRHAATLRGWVAPDRAATRYWFEYVTQRGTQDVDVEDATTAPKTVPACIRHKDVTIRVAGLRAGRKYTYWVVAKNLKGQTRSAAVTFRTRRP